MSKFCRGYTFTATGHMVKCCNPEFILKIQNTEDYSLKLIGTNKNMRDVNKTYCHSVSHGVSEGCNMKSLTRLMLIYQSCNTKKLYL